jgi:hypothetical protein
MTTQRKTPDRPTIERVLREAGLSSRQAKKLLSGGWKLLRGDNAEEEEAIADALDALRAVLFRKT